MIKLGSGLTRRTQQAVVGVISLIGIGASPAAMSDQKMDISYAPAAIRLGFAKALPDTAAPAPVAKPRVASATHRKGDRLSTKMSVADQNCLAEALYYEARGEGRAGQLAVAEVVVRRAHTPGYPRTVCGVVYQGNPGGTTNCQFTWACNGDMKRNRENAAWRTARRLAHNIAAGKVALGDTTNHALFFHASTVRPNWHGVVRTTRIGHHIFYRRNGTWHGRPMEQTRTREAARTETTHRLPDPTDAVDAVIAPLIATEPLPVMGLPLSTEVRPTMASAGDGV